MSNPSGSVSKQRREARRRQREAARTQQRRRPILLAACGVVVIALVVAGVLWYHSSHKPVAPAVMPLNTVVDVPDEGRTHVADGSSISYQHEPPASGPHYPAPGPWQVSSTPVPAGSWVHNLEHGGIVLLYKCDSGSCDQTAQQVRDLAKTLPPSVKWSEVKFVATPYSQMTSPFTLVAWDHEEALDTLDANAVRSFYQTYLDRGPEDVA